MNVSDGEPRQLYRWQLEALVSWLQCGRRGVVEAVTGSGKTDVAIAAARDARRRDLFVLVLVPSRVLMEQWYQRMCEALPQERIGRLGDRGRDEPDACDILIATRHSAASHRPVPPGGRSGLLIVDECHGLGGRVLRRALLTPYTERLGLTATLERTDDAVADLLLPFFGGICFRYGFDAAIEDGVCARPRVAFVGVPLTRAERADYLATEAQLVGARGHLRTVRGMPREPFGAFLAAVGHLAEHDAGSDGRAAREYLDAFAKRRQIVAQSSGKYELLGRFAPAISRAHGALLFTETVRAANHAINRLDPLVGIDLVTGTTGRRQRQDILDDLRARRLDAVAAPRVLDEGIDVPDANLGIVMSASRTRRQMIQRMGRILRRKRPGVGARFVILFAKDTLEDPATRLERDGFLDEMERIAEAAGVFDSVRFEELETFLEVPGPAVLPEVERAVPLDAHLMPTDPVEVRVYAALGGPEQLYARAAYLRSDLPPAHLATVLCATGELLATPERPAIEYLELEEPELPVLRKPKVEPRRLSTGQAPLEITGPAGAFRMRCTGCGEQSEAVRFRWQVLDQTVSCRCA